MAQALGQDLEQDEAVLYVLAAPQSGAPAYLMHEVGGVPCVLAYTDLDRLAECCGEHQPWLGIRIGALMTDLRDQRLPGPVVNLPLNPVAWWTAEGAPWRAAVGGDPASVADGDSAVSDGTVSKEWLL